MNLNKTIPLLIISLLTISYQSNAETGKQLYMQQATELAQINTGHKTFPKTQLGKILAETIAQSPHPFSGSILVTKDGMPLFSYHRGSEVTKQSQFVIASLSKQLTATLILQAVDQGKIDLATPLSAYLGDTGYDDQITIHQLLSHTSGVNALGKPNQFNPGSQYRYSNLGYSLLAQVLEKVNQQAYSAQIKQFANRYDLQQLEAQTGALVDIAQTIPTLALGLQEKEHVVPAELVIDEALIPAGGLIASIGSFSQFQNLLHSGKLISKPSYQAMTQVHVEYDYMWSGMGYGYGLRINHEQGLTEFGHMGYLPGYMSLSLHYPDPNIGLVMLENLSLNLNDFDRAFELHTQIREAIRVYLVAHSK